MTFNTIIPLPNGSEDAIENAVDGAALVYKKKYTPYQFVIPYQSFNLTWMRDLEVSPPVYEAQSIEDTIVLKKLSSIEAYSILQEAEETINENPSTLYVSDSIDEKLLNDYKNTV